MPERQEFLTRILPSYIEDVQREETAIIGRTITFHAASLLLAGYIQQLPLGDSVRRSLNIFDLDAVRFAARLREYSRYDDLNPLT